MATQEEWRQARKGRPELDVIFTTHATAEDLRRAEEQDKIVMVFLPIPPEVADEETRRVWTAGYLAGCGIPPSDRMQLWFYPSHLDSESIIIGYQKRLAEGGAKQHGCPWKLGQSFSNAVDVTAASMPRYVAPQDMEKVYGKLHDIKITDISLVDAPKCKCCGKTMDAANDHQWHCENTGCVAYHVLVDCGVMPTVWPAQPRRELTFDDRCPLCKGEAVLCDNGYWLYDCSTKVDDEGTVVDEGAECKRRRGAMAYPGTLIEQSLRVAPVIVPPPNGPYDVWWPDCPAELDGKMLTSAEDAASTRPLLGARTNGLIAYFAQYPNQSIRLHRGNPEDPQADKPEEEDR